MHRLVLVAPASWRQASNREAWSRAAGCDIRKCCFWTVENLTGSGTGNALNVPAHGHERRSRAYMESGA